MNEENLNTEEYPKKETEEEKTANLMKVLKTMKFRNYKKEDKDYSDWLKSYDLSPELRNHHDQEVIGWRVKGHKFIDYPYLCCSYLRKTPCSLKKLRKSLRGFEYDRWTWYDQKIIIIASQTLPYPLNDPAIEPERKKLYQQQEEIMIHDFLYEPLSSWRKEEKSIIEVSAEIYYCSLRYVVSYKVNDRGERIDVHTHVIPYKETLHYEVTESDKTIGLRMALNDQDIRAVALLKDLSPEQVRTFTRQNTEFLKKLYKDAGVDTSMCSKCDHRLRYSKKLKERIKQHDQTLTVKKDFPHVYRCYGDHCQHFHDTTKDYGELRLKERINTELSLINGY
jgi:uncharacterized protein YihD (DUF1040 family)